MQMILLMAENEHDMQRNLNLLNTYCNCNKLKVNISKTKKYGICQVKNKVK